MDYASKIIGQLAELSTASVARSQLISDQLGIHPIDLESIEWLSRQPFATAGELGKAMKLSSGGVTKLVDRLVAKQLIKTSPDADDRRKIRISTAENEIRTRVEPLFADLVQSLRAVISHYGDGELAVISRFLQEIVAVEPQADTSSRPS